VIFIKSTGGKHGVFDYTRGDLSFTKRYSRKKVEIKKPSLS